MVSLLDGLAQYLADRGIGVYDPNGGAEAADWAIFMEHLPSSPDRAIALTLYGGRAPDSRNPWDFPRLQVRVRGTNDPRDSHAKADAVYSLLHGLSSTPLPGGIWLSLATGVQSGPMPIGVDGNARHEHVVNFELSITNPTAHRA